MKPALLSLLASLALGPLAACQPEATADPETPAPATEPSKPPQEPKDEDFIGMTEAEAGALAEQRELKHRTLERDGEKFPATKDYREDRVNFTVEEGKVVKVSRG